MIAWTWDARAPDAEGCGVSCGEDGAWPPRRLGCASTRPPPPAPRPCDWTPWSWPTCLPGRVSWQPGMATRSRGSRRRSDRNRPKSDQVQADPREDRGRGPAAGDVRPVRRGAVEGDRVRRRDMPEGPAAAVPRGRAHAAGAEHAVPRRGRAARRRARGSRTRWRGGGTRPAICSRSSPARSACPSRPSATPKRGRRWQGRRFWQRVDLALKADGALLARYDAWRAGSLPGSTAGEPVITTTPVQYGADGVVITLACPSTTWTRYASLSC